MYTFNARSRYWDFGHQHIPTSHRYRKNATLHPPHLCKKDMTAHGVLCNIPFRRVNVLRSTDPRVLCRAVTVSRLAMHCLTHLPLQGTFQLTYSGSQLLSSQTTPSMNLSLALWMCASRWPGLWECRVAIAMAAEDHCSWSPRHCQALPVWQQLHCHAVAHMWHKKPNMNRGMRSDSEHRMTNMLTTDKCHGSCKTLTLGWLSDDFVHSIWSKSLKCTDLRNGIHRF